MNALRALRQFFHDIQDARTRGKHLLRANLTAVQLRELDALNYFEVTGGASGTSYRIHNSANINVDELDEQRKVVCKWCFGPEGSLVRGDILLAQKLALELFECDTLAVANRHPVEEFAPHWSRPGC
jgi:hypothetical protein